MPATRLRLTPEVRRQQIIDAARSLYDERPYEDVSTRELAEAAGVARGLINHYFGDKRELFLAVMRDSVVLPDETLPDFAGKDLDNRVRLTIDWIMVGAEKHGLAWVNASGTTNLLGDTDVQDIMDGANDIAARLMLDALGLDDSPKLRTLFIAHAGMVKGTIREWLQNGTLTRDETLDLLTSSLSNVISFHASRKR